MRRNVWLTAFLLIVAVPAIGQDRGVWRTAADIRENAVGSVVGTVLDTDSARGRLRLQLDNDPHQPVVVMSDAVTTQYYGFGGIINGSPEIFRGSSGLANVRIGDRLDVHGQGRPGAAIAAAQVTLLGRSVEAGTVGVGTTRDGTSISTPTADSNIPSTADVGPGGYAEGTIRQINADEGRIVIQTPQRRMITINAGRTTPVYYRGQRYQIGNLEVGDVIRVDPDARTAAADEVNAVSIEVTRAVQDAPRGRQADQRLTAVIGRVTRVDAAADTIQVDSGRETVLVDLAGAADADNRRIRAADLRVGDRVDVTGRYSSSSNMFIASTVRFGGDVATTPRTDSEVFVESNRALSDLVVVTFSGTVVESLETSPTLLVRDRTTGRTSEIFVTNDFLIRTRAGGYATATALRANDSVLIKAYRDDRGNLVAQTIRVR